VCRWRRSNHWQPRPITRLDPIGRERPLRSLIRLKSGGVRPLVVAVVLFQAWYFGSPD
jgi:hypothetical protein